MTPTRVAVVGHIEWVDFLAVAQTPAVGQITPASRVRMNAGGGAVVAAVVMAGLGARVEFFGAVGDDEIGRRAVDELKAHGIRVACAVRDAPTRQVITFLDARGERSIVTIGARLQPAGADPLDWERLARVDGVYFTAGDLGALHHARASRVLTATPRIAERLPSIDVNLDALILSGDDRTERDWAAGLAQRAALQVVTEGEHGGSWSGAAAGRWEPVAPPGPVRDAYGAGDSFAAGFTLGLACSGDPAVAARVGAECGARALTVAGGP
ncbi:MAG TPA: PfkB family carbohydrate kinase [Solirubrobacteraceae bacterium]|nr:PfkB family carbohydrate kinase [Solirubrobacteraceae bacterium]